MNTKSELDFRLEELSRKLSKVTCKFENVQHAEFEQGGWCPGQSGSDFNNVGSIADALSDIASAGDNDVVAAKLRALVNALKRAPSAVVERATVHSGATREPLVIKSADGGARAKVVGTQVFSDEKQNIVNLDKTPSLLAACKRDVAQTMQNRIAASHKLPTAPKATLKHETYYNADRTKMEMIGQRQSEFEQRVLEDAKSLRKVSERCYQRRREHEARLAAGRGTLDDLREKRNEILYS